MVLHELLTLLEFPPQITQSLKILKTKINLSERLAQCENENEALNVTIHDLSMKLEKAKVELSETISENNHAKNLIETELAAKQSELVDVKELSKDFKREIEDLQKENKSAVKNIKKLEKDVKTLKHKNEQASENLEKAEHEVDILTREKIKVEKQSVLSNYKSTKVIEDIEHNIETNNPFEVLAEPNIEASNSDKQKVHAQSDKAADVKPPKIDRSNYRKAFTDFLENYGEKSLEPPKYLVVAKQMVQNNYNMFQMQLKDIKKFNPNLAGFMAAEHRNLSSEITGIIKKFIEGQNGVVLKHGLYFNLSRISS